MFDRPSSANCSSNYEVSSRGVSGAAFACLWLCIGPPVCSRSSSTATLEILRRVRLAPGKPLHTRNGGAATVVSSRTEGALHALRIFRSCAQGVPGVRVSKQVYVHRQRHSSLKTRVFRIFELGNFTFYIKKNFQMARNNFYKQSRWSFTFLQLIH